MYSWVRNNSWMFYLIINIPKMFFLHSHITHITYFHLCIYHFSFIFPIAFILLIILLPLRLSFIMEVPQMLRLFACMHACVWVCVCVCVPLFFYISRVVCSRCAVPQHCRDQHAGPHTVIMTRGRVRHIMVSVTARVKLQETNVSLCRVPTCDNNNDVCVYVSLFYTPYHAFIISTQAQRFQISGASNALRRAAATVPYTEMSDDYTSGLRGEKGLKERCEGREWSARAWKPSQPCGRTHSLIM